MMIRYCTLISLLGCGGATITNGQVHFPSGTDYNAVAIVTCSNGYHLTADNRIVCMHSGVWNMTVQCEINGMPSGFSSDR